MPADGTLVMEDARIMFRNFAGLEGQYNRQGDRNFCVMLDEGLARTMAADGWNIKTLKSRDADEDDQPYIQVAVSFKNRPPTIMMITSKGRTPIPEDMCEVIDWIDIKTVDLIVSPYAWSVNGKNGIKAYLKSLYVVVNEDYLALKYANVPEIGAGSNEPLALEARPYADFEGEVVG